VWLEGELAAVRGGAQPRQGVALQAGAELYPLVGDLPGWFGGAEAELRGYVTAGPTLALRLGGRKAWGSVPVQEAALLGGRRTLRGYPFQRFAGDAAVYGGAELRAGLGRVRLLTRGQLGALVLADAGRVFVDGESPGGWHGALGGGLTFTTMDATVSATYARGEAGHLYLGFGFPF
jgi:outer membrane translocation and assembly module TamA